MGLECGQFCDNMHSEIVRYRLSTGMCGFRLLSGMCNAVKWRVSVLVWRSENGKWRTDYKWCTARVTMVTQSVHYTLHTMLSRQLQLNCSISFMLNSCLIRNSIPL